LDIVSNGSVREANRQCEGLAGVDLTALVAQRGEGIPLEYVLGRATFNGLGLYCTPAALIPRAETELLVHTILEVIREKQSRSNTLKIVDMGTGSGNIAVALAAHTDNTFVVASDVSDEAVALARRNAAMHGLEERIRFFCGDLFEPLRDLGYEGNIDIVVCNPPYIPSSSLAKMEAEIVDHEPVVALDAGAYGIDIFRRLSRDALVFLRPGGVLAFEIGMGQEKIAARLLANAGGYEDILTVADISGNVRVMVAIRS